MLKRLSSLIQGTGNSTFDFISLVRRWPEIVGKRLAEETIPLKNQGRTLVILTNHPGHAQGLNFMQEALKEKIVMIFPSLKKSLKDIRFQYKPGFFARKKQQNDIVKKNSLAKTSPQFHPYSPEYRKFKKQAEEYLENIVDPELKKTLVSLYLQIFLAK